MANKSFKETFTLNRKHTQNLGKQILENKQLADLKLSVNGKTLDVHKVVLAARSKYFESMVCGSFKETQQDTIDLSDTIKSFEVLNDIVNYMYVGTIEITSNNFEAILAVANQLLLFDVRDYCAQLLYKRLTLENSVRTLALADMYSICNLKEMCLDMVLCRFKDYHQFTDHILEIPGEFMVKLADLEAFKFMKQSEILQFLHKWWLHQKQERTAEVVAILKTLMTVGHLHLGSGSLGKIESLDPNVMSVVFEAVIHSPRPSVIPERRKVLMTCTLGGSYRTGAMYHRVTKPSRMTGTQELVVKLYIPLTDQWYIFTCNSQLPQDCHEPAQFLGFLDQGFVFKLEKELLLLGFLSKHASESILSWKTINAPRMKPSIRSITVHNDNVFQVIHTYQKTPYILIQKVNLELMKWEILCKTSINDIEASEMTSLLPCPNDDTLYIVMLTNKNMKIIQVLSMGNGEFQLDVNIPTFPWKKERPFDVSVLARGESVLIQSTDTIYAFNTHRMMWEVNEIEDGHSKSTPQPQLASDVRSRYLHYGETFEIDVNMVSGKLDTGNCNRAYFHVKGFKSGAFSGGREDFTARVWLGAGRSPNPEELKWIEMNPPPPWGKMKNEATVYSVPTKILMTHFDLYINFPEEKARKKFSSHQHSKLPIDGEGDEEVDDCDVDNLYSEKQDKEDLHVFRHYCHCDAWHKYEKCELRYKEEEEEEEEYY